MDTTWEMPNELAGAAALNERFGLGHTFHDGEVLSIHLNRTGLSSLRIHTWKILNEVDENGHYSSVNHAVVTFGFVTVLECELGGFNRQNVIGSLRVERLREGYKLIMESTYGVGGSITASMVRLEIEPGRP